MFSRFPSLLALALLSATLLSACFTPPLEEPAMNAKRSAQAPVIAAGTNAHFSHSVTVRAPASRVWSIWMDVANWPTWDVEIKEARSAAPLALGVEGSLVPAAGFSSTFKVTDLAEGQRYAFETSLPLARLTVTRELEQSNDATTFRHEVEFSGFAGPIFAAVLGPRFREALPKAMERIANQAVVPR